MSLKAAIGWSVVFHVGLLVMQPPQGLIPPEEDKPIKVAYLPTTVTLPSHPAVTKSQPPPAPVAPKPPQAAVPKKTPESPAPIPKPVIQENPRPIIPRPVSSSPSVQNGPVTVRDVPTHDSPIISNLSEGEFAALQHKQQVRQHLKAHLDFPPNGIQGTVRLRLVLGPKGLLEDLLLLDASDSRLAESALKGAQSAVPYPPFPKEMKKTQVLYEYIIQYRLD